MKRTKNLRVQSSSKTPLSVLDFKDNIELCDGISFLRMDLISRTLGKSSLIINSKSIYTYIHIVS